MVTKLQKMYVTYYNLLTAQDLWQVYCQILSIILLKEFIELNANLDPMIKNVKHAELNISTATVFLECTNFKDDLIKHKRLCSNKSYQRKFDEKLKERFFNTHKFLNNDNNKFILLL